MVILLTSNTNYTELCAQAKPRFLLKVLLLKAIALISGLLGFWQERGALNSRQFNNPKEIIL